MDEQHARGLVFDRLLVLVGPAPVVRHARAAESRGIGERWVVHEHHERLARHIESLEVVPLVLGGLRAVPHEHQLRLVERRRGLHVLGPRYVIVTPFEGPGGAALGEGQRGGIGHRDADEWHLLCVRAVGIARGEPDGLELGLEIGRRAVFAERAGLTAQQAVGGEYAHMLHQRGRIERRDGFGRYGIAVDGCRAVGIGGRRVRGAWRARRGQQGRQRHDERRTGCPVQ